MLPSGLPEIVGGDEPIAVFLTSSSHFNLQGVKAGAFMPNSKDGEKSACRHGQSPLPNLQALATLYFQHSPVSHVHGAGIVMALEVAKVKLSVTADEPPPRHALIRGWQWSSADPTMGKAENIERAKVLAAKAQLIRW